MHLRTLTGATLGAALLATPAAASAPAAVAAASQATVQVTASGAAAKALRRAGVKLRAPKARAVALADGSTRLTFTAATRTIRRTSATLPLRGELRFTRSGRRSVRFTSLRAEVSASSVRLTARAPGGRRMTVLHGVPAGLGVRLDAGRRAVTVRPTATTFTRTALRMLRSRLALRTVPAGTFGRLIAEGAPSSGGGAGGTTGTGTTQPGGGTGQPGSTATGEPVPLARPATAADVVSATLVWRARESFIRYVNTGEGTTTVGGAVADPPENLPEAGTPLVYQFRFPLRAGWSDAASGTAAVAFSGGVRFRYTDHTIDFTTSDPEIEINGAASRAIFRLSGTGGASLGGKRAVLLELRPHAAASRTVSPDGKTVTYDRIPAVIPSTAVDSVFNGFYLAGTQFGSVTLSYTTT